MTLNLALNSAISGLSTAQAGLDVISNNIANVNTEGFTRKVFAPESIVLTGNGAGVQLGDIINNVDQNLLRDMRNQHSAVGLLQTTNSYYRRVQDTFGTTASNSSISHRINALQQEFTTLTTASESVSQQLAAVQAGVNAARSLADMSRTVQTLRLNADREIEGAVNDMNTYLRNIAALNDQIAMNRATRKQTEDLEDKRDLALNKLSDLVDIRYFQNANGSLTVFTTDGTTLIDNDPARMSHVALSRVSPEASYAGGDFNGIFAGVRDITTSIRSGKIKALVDMRDGILPDMQAQIDELATSLKNQINLVHNRGAAFPNIVNNLTGTRTFMDSSIQTVSFSGGEPSVVLYDSTGAEIASSRILDGAGIAFNNNDNVDTLASSIQTWLQGADPRLVNATVSINSDGNFNINLGTDSVGIAFKDEQNAIKGSQQTDTDVTVDLDGDGQGDKTFKGFSNFLGLNDYFVTKPNLTRWDSAFKPANYSLGIAAAVDLNFSDKSNPTGIPGGRIAVNPGDTLEIIRDAINNNTSLRGRVSADVIPEGSGKRLWIQHDLGEQLVVTQAGGTDAIDTLGLDLTSGGISQALTVSQTLLDDSSRVSRGQVQLDTLTGNYLLATGDNSIASQLSGIVSGPAPFRAAGSLSGTNITFADYAAAIVARSATAAASTDANLKIQADLKEALDLKQAQAAGVNLDEEMSQLLIFQQTYAASAKVISTTSQLFDILNNLID